MLCIPLRSNNLVVSGAGAQHPNLLASTAKCIYCYLVVVHACHCTYMIMPYPVALLFACVIAKGLKVFLLFVDHFSKFRFAGWIIMRDVLWPVDRPPFAYHCRIDGESIHVDSDVPFGPAAVMPLCQFPVLVEWSFPWICALSARWALLPCD